LNPQQDGIFGFVAGKQQREITLKFWAPPCFTVQLSVRRFWIITSGLPTETWDPVPLLLHDTPIAKPIPTTNASARSHLTDFMVSSIGQGYNISGQDDRAGGKIKFRDLKSR
jgi:hypothetical protein